MISNITDISASDFSSVLEYKLPSKVSQRSLSDIASEYNKSVSDYLLLNPTVDIPVATLLIDKGSSENGLFKDGNGAYMFLIDSIPVFITKELSSPYMDFNTLVYSCNIGSASRYLAYVAIKLKGSGKFIYYKGTTIFSNETTNIALRKLESLVIVNGEVVPSNILVTQGELPSSVKLGDYLKEHPTILKEITELGGITNAGHLIPQYIKQDFFDDKIPHSDFKLLVSQASMLLQVSGVSDPEFEKIAKILNI